ncbi:hypothetical protein JW964_20985 [candidate division KSB1 bacterium]|nr:hypothetical protein [candidate division KSB1 bacterium]
MNLLALQQKANAVISKLNPINNEGHDMQTIFIFCLLYFTLFVFIRWHLIARPCRAHLLAQIEKLEINLGLRIEKTDLEALLKANELIRKLSQLLKEAKGCATKFSLFDFLFWSRGKEIAGWEMLHDVERQMAMLPQFSNEEVIAELIARKGKLKTIESTETNNFIQSIKAILKSWKKNKKLDVESKPLLMQIRKYFYNQEDTEYAQLITFHNKSIWLIIGGLALILGLSYCCGGQSFFILGAAGGFLSRFSRIQKTKDAITDYGTYWTSLFFSPVVGAISGWAGVLLVIWGSQNNILGQGLESISWDAKPGIAGMLTPFVLGFSERLFSKLITNYEEALSKTEKK